MLEREAPRCCGSTKTLIWVDRREMDLGIKFFTATSNILLWSPQMLPCFLCRASSVRPSRNKAPPATRTAKKLFYSLFRVIYGSDMVAVAVLSAVKVK